jgi:catechol 2,3-dioxygenase-like lactoylglutathione lyase family enzyme
MTVRRIVANIAAAELDKARRFYGDIFGLDLLMNLDFIATYGSRQTMNVQLSVMTEGGSGTPVPDISIEVEDVDAMHARVLAAGIAIEYGPANEPWGVRRFYVRDPFGKLINVLAHR